ncbi:DsbA family protein (plasmid) [Pontibacillus sp. ALD_SL1]|uniref:DsbA family protein n=1 Tax=Pontibacillus sp. ALD_SL1 TaxID=2777185 RepID=UPI001A959189|nr:thioredoxin domain-containing protein [Pontibacillus sp. ALD_SL1]QST02965.1 DsbA family protein [Pontibacillus sp. ALD_SL1]
MRKLDRWTNIFLILMALFIGLALWNFFQPEKEKGESFTVKTMTDKPFVLTEQPLVGNKDAKIRFVEFGDYNCSHCQRWDEEIFPILEEKYIDSGLASFRFVHFPVVNATTTSFYAAMASEWVWENHRDQYWEFHHDLYQAAKGFRTLSFDYLATQASDLTGEAKEAILPKLKDEKYMDNVLADKQYAIENGIAATPTLMINGKVIENAFDLEEIDRVIKESTQSE